MAHKMPPTVKVPIRDDDNRKKFYKPSIAESQNAFILHVTVGTFNIIVITFMSKLETRTCPIGIFPG